jgi:ubiquinol-cytochrome c reductase iron-sulfur subunit
MRRPQQAGNCTRAYTIVARGERRTDVWTIGQQAGERLMAESVVVGDGEVDLSRRKFLTTATVATGAVGAVFAAVPFIASWAPSERAKALGAPAELDVSKIEPGQMAIVTWRRQPIYVVRRTPEMLGQLKGHDELLKDKDSTDSDQPPYAKNEYRARLPEVLVLIGTCTHLGCLPKQRFEAHSAEMGAYWPGGFFCPCHGSRFDLAGRVFNGSPASVNLKVPPYDYPSPLKLVIGVDETHKGAA